MTAARTSEVLDVRWSEIDEAGVLWTVPAARMKAGRDHRVSLSARSRNLLIREKALGEGSALIFPGGSGSKSLSIKVSMMAVPITAQGFRSSFRYWAAETTSYPNEVAEMALAHIVTNCVEVACRRGDLLEKRR